MRRWETLLAFLVPVLLLAPAAAGVAGEPAAPPVPDEFRVKREEVFEFAEKPSVVRQGDRVTISFASKGRCDATVAVEDAGGRIVRHLACGVLGPRAPEPFRKDALKQTLIWDGKDDRGEYVDDKDGLTVRVSLGLAPAFERNLLWEPRRRHGGSAPLFQAAPEGVYVYDGGNGIDSVRLYGHDGSYLRTVYPFPADKIDRVVGIPRAVFPQDGLELPVKPTFLGQTLLTCGNLYGYEYPKKYAVAATQADGNCHYGMYGNASSILAVGGGRLALGKTYLFRMATDGTSGGASAPGPSLSLVAKGLGWDTRGETIAVAPRSAALSPDGRTLYLTGYNFGHSGHASADIVTNGRWQTFHCVMKMALDGDEPARLFAGSAEADKCGSDDRSFKVPASVAVDKAGRVYVADYMNDRVQVFSPDGALLKSIATRRPSIVSIDGKTQDIWVFSSVVHNIFLAKNEEKIDHRLTVFGPFEKPEKKASCPLPEGYRTEAGAHLYSGLGFPLSAAVDGYTDPPTVWLATEWARENVLTRGKIAYRNVDLYAFKDGRLELKRSFADDVEKSVKRASPPRFGRSRLYVNPRNGRVYVGEGEAFDWKSFKTLLELDPETGGITLRPVPFDAEDMCFGPEGLAYLRNINAVVRYDPSTWREVPWDYGESRKRVCTSASSDRREADAISALPLPANGGWHHGGMFVSLKGDLAVACGLNVEPPKERFETGNVSIEGVSYRPKMFPGRSIEGRGGAPLVHVWDRHGKLVQADVLPGLGGNTYGLGLDADGSVTMMANATRVLDGKPYRNRLSGTLLRAVPGKARLLSQKAKIPLAGPDRDRKSVV